MASSSPRMSSEFGSDTHGARSSRGLNKPKCINCGNVARSRCPFQCCKNCCAKAQNPCHIHVLKPNGTLADRGASTTAAPPEKQPTEVAPLLPPPKVTNIRQLSTAFSQFNNLHIPLRSRKPLSRAEALVINEWRFAKLKEYKESGIEAENEAFDRYMQNISLLEQVFEVNHDTPEDDTTQTLTEKKKMVSEMKARIRSNPVRIDSFRKRIRQAVDQGLKNIQTYQPNHYSSNLDDEGDPTPKAAKTSALAELNDKLNRARNEDDLKLCTQIRAKIRGEAKFTSQKKFESSELVTEQTNNNTGAAQPAQGPEKFLLQPVRATEIDQDALNAVEFCFSALEEIEDL